MIGLNSHSATVPHGPARLRLAGRAHALLPEPEPGWDPPCRARSPRPLPAQGIREKRRSNNLRLDRLSGPESLVPAPRVPADPAPSHFWLDRAFHSGGRISGPVLIHAAAANVC